MAPRTAESFRRRANRDGDESETIHLESGRRLTYTEYGAPDGVPVVVLHGTPGSRRIGQLFDASATELGIRVLAFDRPGYGHSSPWPTRSVRDAGTVVERVLDDAGVQTAGLIVFSGGGPYALSTAATHGARISRVDVLAGATPPEAGAATPITQRLLAGLARRTPRFLRGVFRGQAWLAARLDPSFVVAQYTAADNAESVPDAAAEIVHADFLEAFTDHRSGAVTELRNTATDWHLDFDEIDTAVSLWHGSNDTNVPIAGVRWLESQIPTARLRVLDDADHLQTLLRSIPDVLERHR